MARRKTRTGGEKHYDGKINNQYYHLIDRDLSQQCKSTYTWLSETCLVSDVGFDLVVVVSIFLSQLI